MDRMRRGCLVAGLLIVISLGSRPSEAQYTADHQTNTISGVASNWPTAYAVGGTTSFDVLLIQNGGLLTDSLAYLGNIPFSSNNSALVTGTGSAWINNGPLYVGFNGDDNDLTISAGGFVGSSNAYIGYQPDSSNNSAVVTGSGSVWSNRSSLYIGYHGSGNRLVIEDGARVFGSCHIGFSNLGSNNNLIVTGPNTVLTNGGILIVGENGAQNSLVISNGAQIYNVSGQVGNGPGGNSNTVIVTGNGSKWSSVSYVGFLGSSNRLVISDGGEVDGDFVQVGSVTGSSNNSVLVTGSGSLWNNAGEVDIGGYGSGNALVISNGGWVTSYLAFIGFGSSNNSVVVTGSGSVWSNGNSFSLASANNSLAIRDGGQVISRSSSLAGSQKLTALVTGPGSVWSNAGSLSLIGFSLGSSMVISNDGRVICGYGLLVNRNVVRVVDGGVWQSDMLHIGDGGASNLVVVAGGSIQSTNLVVGSTLSLCDDVLQLDSGTVVVTNVTADAVLEVRYGKLVINGGTLRADILDLTKGCRQIVHTGGTLLVGKVVLDPNTFRIVSVARQGNDLLVTWMMGPGATNTLQMATGGVGGSYNTNGFSDIFIVTNNTTFGTVTNYLDVGAATNVPARYYRARFVP